MKRLSKNIARSALKLAMGEHRFVPIMKETFMVSFNYYLNKEIENAERQAKRRGSRKI